MAVNDSKHWAESQFIALSSTFTKVAKLSDVLALAKAGQDICIMLPYRATGETSRLTHSPTCQEAKQITRRNPPIGITYDKIPPIGITLDSQEYSCST